MPTAPPPLLDAPPSPWPPRLLAASLIWLTFSLTLFAYTRHQDSPVNYHPDEAGKTSQILSDGLRNFRHPLLMLEVTQHATDWLHTPRDWQAVTEVGRRVSAVFAAGAVAALCAAAYLDGGLLGLLLVGIPVALCPITVVYAHYFKEDAALLLGVGLVVLSVRCFIKTKTVTGRVLSLLFVGLACALALSGKYCGIAFLPAAMLAVAAAPSTGRTWLRRWGKRLLRPLVVVPAAALFAVIINYRALLDLPDFRAALSWETDHAITDHNGLTLNRPTSYFLEATWRQTSPVITLLAALAFVLLIITWRRRNTWDVFVVLLGPAYLALVSFSSIPFYRYVLPTVLLAHAAAGLALLWLLELLPPRPALRAAVATLAILALIFVELPPLLSIGGQFANDGRDQARSWLIANVLPNTQVAAERYACLLERPEAVTFFNNSPGIGDRIYVRESFFGPDLGSLTSLPRQGIGYVVIVASTYERYLTPQVISTPEEQQTFTRRRTWYQNLINNYELVWHYIPSPDTHSFTSPEVRIYRIKSPEETAP